jgi:hypothetical protein
MTDKHREEVLNVTLAELLCGYGMAATPESIQTKAHGGSKALPDVLIQYRGMRLAIEGKYADVARSEAVVSKQAQERIDTGISQISLAVQYVPELRTTPFTKLSKAMGEARLRFCVYSEVGAGKWHDGGIASVLDEIRRVHESMCKEDVVQLAAESIKGYLDGVAKLFEAHPRICDELSEVLGVGRPGKEDKKTHEARMRTIASVSALTLANAFIFQEQLAASGVAKVISLRETLRYKDLIHRTIQHWDWICTNINYVPIFRLATDILAKIPAGSAPDGAVRALAEKALEVCANKAALRHDLMGRIYHYLLHEAKYLGTYYTSVPAATLLLKLSLDPARWPDRDFSDAKSLRELHVVDLTCGTGTLLMAACQAITDNFVVANAKAHRKLDVKRLGILHAALMEYVMHGYDVLPSAIHLTASTLSLLAPEVLFKKLHLYSMPLSVKRNTILLGSLEFIERARSKTQLNLFEAETAESESREITGKGYVGTTAEVPETDLFVMNPPFVRSVNGNLLFGSLGDAHREKMQTELKRRVGSTDFPANITAGLGSVFVAIADKYIKQGGRLAFVLPAALASGIAWSVTRDLIASRYHLEYVVTSHDPSRWSFSENTDLSELLFVARRLNDRENVKKAKTTFINLWRNPSNIGDALAVSRLIRAIEATSTTDHPSPTGVSHLSEMGRKHGEVIILETEDTKHLWWGGAFAQTDLTRAFHALKNGYLLLPGHKPTAFPITTLDKLADLGPDARDVHDAFEVVGHPSAFPAFWDHDANKVTSYNQSPNSWLSARSIPAPGRKKIIPSTRLWPKASALLIAWRLRLNTQRLISVLVDKEVLSNTWFTLLLKGDVDDRARRAMVLWLNSSLGVGTMVFARVPTEGAWVQFKKPTLLGLPVLDVTALSDSALNTLSKAFDSLASATLLPFSQMGTDRARAAIDNALSSAIGIADLTPLRDMLGREPVVTNMSLLPSEKEILEDLPQLDLLFS